MSPRHLLIARRSGHALARWNRVAEDGESDSVVEAFRVEAARIHKNALQAQWRFLTGTMAEPGQFYVPFPVTGRAAGGAQ